jgi:bifunctional UDP-N-acetylglucosamine pyrophosphorylase/glucosamine-1-phosphate N-acetyltransferase
VQVAGAFWKANEGDLLVLSGDVPLISTLTLRRLLDQHKKSGASVTLLSTKLTDATGYGRVVRGAGGEVESIVEHKDATDEQRRISEINTGIYCFAIADLAHVIDALSAENSQKEYYLTDCIGLLRKQNKRAGAVICEDPSEVRGVNSRDERAEHDPRRGWSARPLPRRAVPGFCSSVPLEARGVNLSVNSHTDQIWDQIWAFSRTCDQFELH